MENEMINIDKMVFSNIREQMEDLLLSLESLELASDSEFVESMKRSEEQIRNNEVGSWDDL